MRKIIALLALVMLMAAPVANAAWLMSDSEGNLIHWPITQQNIDGEPWVDSLFLGINY